MKLRTKKSHGVITLIQISYNIHKPIFIQSRQTLPITWWATFKCAIRILSAKHAQKTIAVKDVTSFLNPSPTGHVLGKDKLVTLVPMGPLRHWPKNLLACSLGIGFFFLVFETMMTETTHVCYWTALIAARAVNSCRPCFVTFSCAFAIIITSFYFIIHI